MVISLWFRTPIKTGDEPMYSWEIFAVTAQPSGLSTVIYPDSEKTYLQLLNDLGGVDAEFAVDNIERIEFA